VLKRGSSVLAISVLFEYCKNSDLAFLNWNPFDLEISPEVIL
jgi:hypothetical protein